MDLQLAGKVALVTGSSRGLGFAIARALVEEGCRVCICARGAEQLATAAAELRALHGDPAGILDVPANLATSEGIEAVVRATVEAFGGLDVLVNNVGKAGGGDLLETPDGDWQEALDQTLYPAIRASRAAVPHMRARGAGSIIMVASIWGRESGGRMTYNAVKAAEISLAKSLAQQLARDGIRVNSIAPGSILFPGGSWHRRQVDDPKWFASFVERDFPFGRLGTPEEVGSLVAFLASPRASWVSGACVTVDGCQSRSLI